MRFGSRQVITAAVTIMLATALEMGQRALAARGESPAAFDGRCIPGGCVAPPCRVEDGRGHDRRGELLVRLLSQNAGASIHTMTPFPASAHRTGRADFPH